MAPSYLSEGAVIAQDQSVQEALRSGRCLLDAMLRPFPNGSINVFDRDLRYLYAAGTTFDRGGLSPDGLIGRRIEALFPAEFVVLVTPFYARVFAGETVT